ncbi:stage V sporulation protein B [Paenibacillus aceris]|uniref:Stage V sporulation protein B n=1 Tax=Paenibacillus aceris TaxID=869555 RepID=A0ABS4I5A9_9BACL|nr:stage V sporulation protein B [Paenibacillus aceris]MBP1966015.1 stage V sporulation protein B [Paenibacillus aceris]NHW39757.1 stage V sporulation protein B [Paenibacillus aceris]
MTKQSFIRGTMILLAAGILNRILGFIPRITLPRVIGAEGIGIYHMGWPFLSVILTIITGGIPVAIAKLIAEAEAERNETRIRSILRISLAITISLSILFTIACVAGASWITSHLLTDTRVYYTFLTMSPMIPIIGISAVYRGYFQGRQNMIPTATSQIMETLIRIVMVLVCSYVMIPYGVEYAAAGAMMGVLAGEIGGLAVLAIHFRYDKKTSPKLPAAQIGTTKTNGRLANFRRILRISVPITGSKLIGASSYLFESILIAQSLAIAGITTSLATAQYGALQGMIIPIILLPSALTMSLSVSLVPSLSEAAARKDIKTIHARLHQSLKLALVTGAPFAVLMYVLAEPICRYMYNQPDVGIMLKMMAPIAIFIYFQAPLQSTLQALNKPGAALINTLIGSSVKLILIYWLASKPELGIHGAVFAINVNIVLVTLLHWNSVVRLLKFRMEGSDFGKIGAAMALSGLCCYFVMYLPWTSVEWLRFVISSLTGFGVYMFFITVFRLISLKDLTRLMNMGKKIIR